MARYLPLFGDVVLIIIDLNKSSRKEIYFYRYISEVNRCGVFVKKQKRNCFCGSFDKNYFMDIQKINTEKFGGNKFD